MPAYPIGVTRSLGTWGFNNRHVERMNDNASYDAAHPDDTLILAGPARRSVARSDRSSARTLRALGMFQTFSMQSQAPVQPMMAIGSARSFFLRGKSQSSWSIQRVMLNGLNLLRALYHNAVEAGVNVVTTAAFITGHALGPGVRERIEAALANMSDEEYVPVLEDGSRYVGLLLKSDLVNLYNKEVVKKAFRRA